LPLFWVDLGYGLVDVDPRVVDKDVKATQTGGHGVDQIPGCTRLFEVSLHCHMPVSLEAPDGSRRRPLIVRIVHRNTRARAGKALSSGAAYTT